MAEPTDTKDAKVTGIDEVLNTLRQEPKHPNEYQEDIDRIFPPVVQYYEAVGGFEQSKKLDDPEIFVIGDVHARPEALANALELMKKHIESKDKGDGSGKKSLNEELTNRNVVLAFVGDLVHSEKTDQHQRIDTPENRKKVAIENMNTILGIMKLKAFYPDSIFIVKGNHDDLALEVGRVFKGGVDQGKLLNSILDKYGLVAPVKEMLDSLPILTGIHTKSGEHLLVSHALPIGFYKERVNNVYNATSKGVKTPYLIEPIDTSKSQQDILAGLKNPNHKIKDLFTLSKIGEPNNVPELYLPSGVQLNKEEGQELDEEVNKQTYNFLTRFIKKTFGQSKEGIDISPRDILWLVGHEVRYGLSWNTAKWFDEKNRNRLKIFQLNDQHELPVVRFQFSELKRSRNVARTLKDRVQKFGNVKNAGKG
jgi:hypothetical protein